VLQRVIEAVREKQENEDDEWFDFSERPIVTKRDVREIIQDLTNEQLLLIKCWVEEEVKKRTPLSK
jgi:transcription initiation factor IIE alpha subunit